MNWPLVLLLSLFGLVMGAATVSLVPFAIEPLLWLAIFLVCAYAVARRVSGMRFLHGLTIGLINSIWVTAVHLALFNKYVIHHMAQASMMKDLLIAHSPRLTLAAVGTAIGLVSGIVIGTLCAMAGRWTRPEAELH